MRARLIGAVLFAALLGTVSFVWVDRHSGTEVRSASESPVRESDSGAPVTVIRSGNQIIVAGDVADAVAKRALLDAVITSSEDVTVVDRVGVTTAAPASDFSTAAPVFEAAAGIGDFALRMSGDGVVTLAGTVTDPDEAAAVQAAAEDAWPGGRVVNEIATGH